MLPQSGHGGLSIAFRCPIVVFAWGLACWGPRLGSRHLVDSKFLVSPVLLSTGHMAMNADLLAPGSSVFYLRGTTGKCVPATVVGPSSFPESVAISYERSGHTQHYRDCPVARLTLPIFRADSPDSDRGPSPPATADVGGAAPGVDAQECAGTLHIALPPLPHDDDNNAPPVLDNALERTPTRRHIVKGNGMCGSAQKQCRYFCVLSSMAGCTWRASGGRPSGTEALAGRGGEGRRDRGANPRGLSG